MVLLRSALVSSLVQRQFRSERASFDIGTRTSGPRAKGITRTQEDARLVGSVAPVINERRAGHGDDDDDDDGKATSTTTAGCG